MIKGPMALSARILGLGQNVTGQDQKLDSPVQLTKWKIGRHEDDCQGDRARKKEAEMERNAQ